MKINSPVGNRGIPKGHGLSKCFGKDDVPSVRRIPKIGDMGFRLKHGFPAVIGAALGKADLSVIGARLDALKGRNSIVRVQLSRASPHDLGNLRVWSNDGYLFDIF